MIRQSNKQGERHVHTEKHLVDMQWQWVKIYLSKTFKIIMIHHVYSYQAHRILLLHKSQAHKHDTIDKGIKNMWKGRRYPLQPRTSIGEEAKAEK